MVCHVHHWTPATTMMSKFKTNHWECNWGWQLRAQCCTVQWQMLYPSTEQCLAEGDGSVCRIHRIECHLGQR
jgi:hypothetical protein